MQTSNAGDAVGAGGVSWQTLRNFRQVMLDNGMQYSVVYYGALDYRHWWAVVQSLYWFAEEHPANVAHRAEDGTDHGRTCVCVCRWRCEQRHSVLAEACRWWTLAGRFYYEF